MTKEAVSVVIHNDRGEILLLQRGPASRSEVGKWENPGGELFSQEDPTHGIQREIREELGVDLIMGGKIFTAEDDNHGWRVNLYHGTVAGSPQIQETDKCTALQWILLIDVLRQDLASFTRADFERIKKEHLLSFLSTF